MFTHKLKLTRAAVRALFASALIAGCAGVLLAAPALAEEGKNNVSAKMAKPLKAAQDDLTAKRYSDATMLKFSADTQRMLFRAGWTISSSKKSMQNTQRFIPGSRFAVEPHY